MSRWMGDLKSWEERRAALKRAIRTVEHTLKTVVNRDVFPYDAPGGASRWRREAPYVEDLVGHVTVEIPLAAFDIARDENDIHLAALAVVEDETPHTVKVTSWTVEVLPGPRLRFTPARHTVEEPAWEQVREVM